MLELLNKKLSRTKTKARYFLLKGKQNNISKPLTLLEELGFSASTYKELNLDLNHLSDIDAQKHFLRVGVDELRPFTHNYTFAPDFYRELYSDVRNFSASEAYRHWVNTGHREHRYPSVTTFLQSFGFSGGAIPEEFSIERYKAPYPDLAHMSRYEGFRHFVQHGLGEGRALPFAPGQGAYFLRTLSDTYRAQGQHALSSLCLDRVLAIAPDDAMAVQAYGDLELEAGHNYLARALYAQARELDPQYFWSIVNGAVAAEKLGLLDEAIELFSRARDQDYGLEMPRQRLRHAAATKFNIRVLDANHEAMAGNRIQAQDIVRNAIEDYRSISPRFALPAPTRIKRSDDRPRIAMVAAHLIPVCWEYRVNQRKLQMELAGYDFEVWPYPEIDDFKDHLHLYDIAIFFRLPAEPDVLDAISYADRLGVTTVYEIDDLIFDEINYPPAFETFSGLVDEFWYAGLVGSATQHMAALSLCDYGIASTPSLQNSISSIVKRKRAFLHRNALSTTKNSHDSAAGGKDLTASDRVTAFYGSGSKSHNENFEALATPALVAAFLKYPNFYLTITGPLVISSALQPFRERIVHHSFIQNKDEYKRILGSADINLAPLTRSTFNDAKSEIKWLEAATLGIPSIVSSSDMYDRTLKSGVDALIANDVDEWTTMLDALVNSASLRDRIAVTAHNKALAEYSLEPMSENLSSIISEIYSAKSSLAHTTGKKRLLVVNTHFAPQSIGGATRSVEGIVGELVTRYSDEFTVEAFCAQQHGRQGKVEQYTACDINVTALAPWDRPDLGLGDIDNNVESVFRAYLKRNPVDLIHFHAMQLLSASPLKVAQEMGIPYVVTTHDGWWLSDHPFLADPAGILVMDSGEWGNKKRISRLKSLLNNAAVVISPSRTFAELYRSRGIFNVIASQNGFSPLKAPRPPKDGPVTVGLLGGLGVAKGALLLYQTLNLSSFDNLAFIVIDHSAAASSMRTEYWGDTPVQIIGRVPQNEMAKLYAKLHVVLAISVCAESFGLVAREALSLRRWVVASDRGAVGEDILEGRNGFKIDVSNPIGLMRTLKIIDGSPQTYKGQTTESPMLTTIAQQADALVDIYRRVLA